MKPDPKPAGTVLPLLVDLMGQLKNDREVLQKHDKSVIAVSWVLIGTAACVASVVVVVALLKGDVPWQLLAVAAVAELGAVLLLRFHRGTMREQRDLVRMQIYVANLVESAQLLLDPATTLQTCVLADSLKDERERLGFHLLGTPDSQRPFLAKASGNLQQNGATVEFDNRPPSK